MLSSTLSMGSPIVAVRVPVSGRAGRSRNTRAGYLAKAQHQMLPAAWRHSPTANTIGRRGPGQQPEVITGELTTAITRNAGQRRLKPRPTRQFMSSADIQAGPARPRITKNSGPCRAATNLSRVQLPGPEQRFLCCYIFLIAMNRRSSGSDLTATSPSAVPAAAMVIAVTYPIVRITFSCS